MDHSEAINGKFTERYLLGELTPAQRDQFEDHYFDCAVCADDVHSCAVFVDNARALLREGPVSEEAAFSGSRGVFARYGLPFQSAALAFVLLLCVVGYENVVTIPHLRSQTAGVSRPEILPTVSLVAMGARAESNPVAAPAAVDFVFEMEIPGGPEFTSYVCEIRDASDALKYSIPVGTNEARDTVRLAIPGTALGAGGYKLVLLGQKPGDALKKLVQYPIQIQ
jgi:Putative zinc-finger